MKIKRFVEFIKESNRYKPIENVLSMVEVEDQFLRLKDVLHYHMMFGYDGVNSISIRLRPNTPDNLFKPKYYDSFNDIYFYNYDIISDKQEISEISTNASDELKKIKYRIESMFPVKMNIEKYSDSMGFNVVISLTKEPIVEAVGITPAYTTGNAHSYNGANLAKARKYVEELAAKDKNELFKIANLQSTKKRSWSEWKWDIDKAMDIATQYYANNPEGIKDTEDVNMDTFPVKTGVIPYTNNIGGTYTNNISQNVGTMGGKNALGPDSLVN